LFAAILETDDAQRLYTALSLLVSAAAEGERTRALLGFGALPALLDGPLEAGAHVVESEREPFRRTLAELWETALAICDVWACAAAAQATGVDCGRLAGVISMPQFVREVADARLIVV
jgi:peroxiredoxin family protein